MKRTTPISSARDLLESGKLQFTKREFSIITGRSVRVIERHLKEDKIARCSKARNKVQITIEETLLYREKMRAGLV